MTGESEQLHYAQQIAGAMAFITSKNIVHLDLAGKCLLFSFVFFVGKKPNRKAKHTIPPVFNQMLEKTRG